MSRLDRLWAEASRDARAIRTATPVHDLLVAVVGAETHATRPGPHAGGEWDDWRALNVRQRRRLIGAGWARPGGLRPDVLADLIAARHSTPDPLGWFYRTALEATVERRSAANRDRHASLARRTGYRTYYDRRDALAKAQGHASLWHYRKEKGWS